MGFWDRVRARHLGWALAAYAPLAAVMFAPWPGVVGRVAERCGGLEPLDVRTTWDAASAEELLGRCGTAGRRAYVQLELVDLLYPAAAGAATLVATLLLARRVLGPRTAARRALLLLPAAAMTVLDYGENVAVWILLLRRPGPVPALADAAGAVTAAKRVTGTIAFTLPLLLAGALGGIALVRWAGDRIARDHRGRSLRP